MKIKVLVILERDGDGFHAYSPAFHGLHMDRSSKDEALQNTIEGLRLYMDSLERHGDPLPVGPDCVEERNRPRNRNHKPPRGALLQTIEVPWRPSQATHGAS